MCVFIHSQSYIYPFFHALHFTKRNYKIPRKLVHINTPFCLLFHCWNRSIVDIHTQNNLNEWSGINTKLEDFRYISLSPSNIDTIDRNNERYLPIVGGIIHATFRIIKHRPISSTSFASRAEPQINSDVCITLKLNLLRPAWRLGLCFYPSGTTRCCFGACGCVRFECVILQWKAIVIHITKHCAKLTMSQIKKKTHNNVCMYPVCSLFLYHHHNVESLCFNLLTIKASFFFQN